MVRLPTKFSAGVVILNSYSNVRTHILISRMIICEFSCAEIIKHQIMKTYGGSGPIAPPTSYRKKVGMSGQLYSPAVLTHGKVPVVPNG
jgi:hypothetical protein